MSNLPKLKVIQPFWDTPEEIRDFEQGKYLPYCAHILIVVEGQVISSYEELLKLAAEEQSKDKEFLEVKFLEIPVGG